MLKLFHGKEIDRDGMKETYGRVLCELASGDERIVYLDADLASPSGALATIGKMHPDRFVDCGIMEANMVGVANGLSAAGMIPFAHTFACFVSRKCLDSVFLTGCFARQNVKLIGSDPGITAEQNGASHAGMEDMGILKNMPEITLMDPCDAVELEAALRIAGDTRGMFYIRYNRKAVRKIYEVGSQFDMRKGNVLREGKDVSIVASGIMVGEALEAAELLEARGIQAKVVDIFTWKPLDEELICACAEETGAVVTAENHNYLTGLGASVAHVLARERPVPIEMVGVPDCFGQVGMLPFQLRIHKMTSEDIEAKALDVIARKKV